MSHPNLNMVVLMVGVFFSGSNPFIYCYFSQRSTDYFLHFADILYATKWYENADDLCKWYILIMGNAQQPLQYDGFGLAYLNLATFAKVNQA